MKFSILSLWIGTAVIAVVITVARIIAEPRDYHWSGSIRNYTGSSGENIVVALCGSDEAGWILAIAESAGGKKTPAITEQSMTIMGHVYALKPGQLRIVIVLEDFSTCVLVPQEKVRVGELQKLIAVGDCDLAGKLSEIVGFEWDKIENRRKTVSESPEGLFNSP